MTVVSSSLLIPFCPCVALCFVWCPLCIRFFVCYSTATEAVSNATFTSSRAGFLTLMVILLLFPPMSVCAFALLLRLSMFLGR